MQIFGGLHFWYDWARDIFDFSFDKKYESINEYDKNFENWPIITAVVP